jgi:RND family efflux transporter MFP subunit
MSRKKWIGVAVVATCLVILLWWTKGKFVSEAEDPVEPAATAGETPVAVARVERHSIDNSLTISGEFKAFQDVDVHAKVAGYIRNIYVDVGDRVKEGQTLAVLEIPELAAQLSGAAAAERRAEDELKKAQSDVGRAESTHNATHSAYDRLKQAADSRAGLVAQQEIDDSQAKDLEAEAQVASAKAGYSAAQQQLEMAQANQKQFSALANYARIVAPFAGVITNRFADTGALIQAGTTSNTQAMPLVRLAQTTKLRLVLEIPESLAGRIHLGDAVKVRVQALNQDFQGKVSRFADSLDRQTRTMETEIDFDNGDGRLIPGMYAETQLNMQSKKDALTIPLEAVTRNGEEATVLVVNAQNEIEERHVKLGLEDNVRVEVVSGVAKQERVVIGSRSQYRVGQKVMPKETGGGDSKAGGAK